MPQQIRPESHYEIIDRILLLLHSSELSSNEIIDVLANCLVICARFQEVQTADLFKGLLQIWKQSGRVPAEPEIMSHIVGEA